MSAVFITGASGFVGQALCQNLIERGMKVRGLVRKNSRNLLLVCGVETVETVSLVTETDWKGKLRGIDHLVHLAGRAHFLNDHQNEAFEAYRKINVEGMENLARGAAQAGVKRFIFLSSVKVYGEGRETPYREEDPPVPEDFYGKSKIEAEDALVRISKETGLEVVILRPPLVYGPGVRANFLILMKVVEKGIPLPLKSIKNLRSLIFLGNLTDAIALCLNHPSAPGEIFLMSDGHDVSTPDLIRLIAHSMGKPARLLPSPPGLLKFSARLVGKSDSAEKLICSLTADISKIQKQLGWKPPFTLEQGIDQTVTWYRKRELPDS